MSLFSNLSFPPAIDDYLAKNSLDVFYDHNYIKLFQSRKKFIHELTFLCNPEQKHSHEVHTNLCGEEVHVQNRRHMNISDDYLKHNIGLALRSKNTHYNSAILYDRTNNKLIGFIITQVGECKDGKKFNKIPALNLICNPGLHKDCGRILMFIYCYSLMQKNYKYGLLELAGTYCNVKGLCLYNKFGFREDLSIKSLKKGSTRYVGNQQFEGKQEATCFPEHLTLSMVVNIQNIKLDDLIDAAIFGKNIPAEDSEPLCSSTYKNAKNDASLARKQVDEALRRLQNQEKIEKYQFEMDDIHDNLLVQNEIDAEYITDKKKVTELLAKRSKTGKIIHDYKKRRRTAAASNSRTKNYAKTIRKEPSRARSMTRSKTRSKTRTRTTTADVDSSSPSHSRRVRTRYTNNYTKRTSQ